AEVGAMRGLRQTLMPHGKKAASKTPMDAYVDGCRATSISTGHPTRKSRRSSSRPTSRPANASGSRRHSKPCLPSLERTFKSASLNRVALRSGIQGGRNLSDHFSANKVLRNRDLGHPERESARVADDLRADPQSSLGARPRDWSMNRNVCSGADS